MGALTQIIIKFLIWAMISSCIALIGFMVMGLFDLGLSKDAEFRIFFFLIGSCIFLQGALVFCINLYQEKGENFAVAPYAGRQKVGKKTALFFSAVLMMMGLICIIVSCFERVAN
jgi:hypothetical protein